MIVYHGTTEIIEKPDVRHSKKYRKSEYPKSNPYFPKRIRGDMIWQIDINLNDIIKTLANLKQIELRKAFDIYYSSKLAVQIADGSYGIENMDAKYLAEDLIENEAELFLKVWD